jgi:hypothetical protein
MLTAVLFIVAQSGHQLMDKHYMIPAHRGTCPAVILAAWVIEIRRTKVQGQLGKTVRETPISKITRTK